MAEFLLAGGASATVSLRPSRTPPLRSGRQSPHAGWGCARFCWLISAAQGVPFGLTKSFLPEGPLVWSRFGAPSHALALFSLLVSASSYGFWASMISISGPQGFQPPHAKALRTYVTPKVAGSAV